MGFRCTCRVFAYGLGGLGLISSLGPAGLGGLGLISSLGPAEVIKSGIHCEPVLLEQFISKINVK